MAAAPASGSTDTAQSSALANDNIAIGEHASSIATQAPLTATVSGHHGRPRGSVGLPDHVLLIEFGFWHASSVFPAARLVSDSLVEAISYPQL